MKKTLSFAATIAVCGCIFASPVKSMLGARGTENIDDAGPAWDTPYATDRLLAIYMGWDFDGTKIEAAYGNVPPLVVNSSSTGHLELTDTGVVAVGGEVTLTSGVIQPVVDVFMAFSYGNDGEVSFEVVMDWAGLQGYQSTVYKAQSFQFQTDDSVSGNGNQEWVMYSLNYTLNTNTKYFYPTIYSTFLPSYMNFDNNVRTYYYPELVGIYINKIDGFQSIRKLYGYNQPYKSLAEQEFYARSYSDALRNRFIKNGYFKVIVRNGVEFNRLGCWLKKLNEDEILQNQEADVVEFGFEP